MVRLEEIVDKVSSYDSSTNVELIKKAYVFSAMVHQGQTRISGEPYLTHPLEVANILANMEMDAVSVATGLLHDTVEDTHTTLGKIEELFGEEVMTIVDGLTKLGKITFHDREMRQADNFRKMIISMAKDIRVVVVKLADRLHNMRTLHALKQDRQVRIAKETLEIYAPLANRLGMAWVKAELEDLSFKYLMPKEYHGIVDQLATGERERQRYIDEVKGSIRDRLAEDGFHARVSGRSKHIYSIYKKMRDNNLDLAHLYDVIGFRIIVESRRECYDVLGVVHGCWKPIPGRFKDYIGLPKNNMYQSIHTAVIGPGGHRMEMQIRTEDMHIMAEEGIAAHWKYKDSFPLDQKDVVRFSWLRQLLNWQKEMKDSAEFMESLKIDLFLEEVFVFTPCGDIKQFPIGATIIDFAYAIHTDIGNRCCGARMNGKMVPLKSRLRNGDTVEIITSESHVPTRDWLGFAATSRARSKIRQWIKTEERRESISLGHDMCEKELRKGGHSLKELLQSGRMERAAREIVGVANVDKLLAAIGYGTVPVGKVLSFLFPSEKRVSTPGMAMAAVSNIIRRIKRRPKDAITVAGINDNLLIQFANCCDVLPGDDIIGFITRGRGITIHSPDCSNVMGLDSERMIDVAWQKDLNYARPATVELVCANEVGILQSITSAISLLKSNIANITIQTVEDSTAICRIQVEVTGLEHLNSIIKSLRNLKKIKRVRRVRP